jgi:hypothetical protein
MRRPLPGTVKHLQPVIRLFGNTVCQLMILVYNFNLKQLFNANINKIQSVHNPRLTTET